MAILLSTAPIPTISTECRSYALLSDSDRQVSFFSKNVVKCDSNLVKKWYRFTDQAGGKMPESCVATWRCGTHAPGWLNGKHPTEAEGIVTRQVCYHWSSGCCQWKNNIRVRNCGVFYVYELQKPPVCHLRYCGGSGGGGQFCGFVTYSLSSELCFIATICTLE